MANEARVFAEGAQDSKVRYFTIADGTAITKGTLLVKSGDRTGLAHTGTVGEIPLGFTVEEKEASGKSLATFKTTERLSSVSSAQELLRRSSPTR